MKIRFLKNSISIDFINPLSANPTKWSNTLKQFVGNLPTNCVSVFDHFVNLVLKGLRINKGNNDYINTLRAMLLQISLNCEKFQADE